ncbi:MAG: bacillithiol biosynthesis deacetylase BshB1 [Bacteroidota bacterium]
MKLDILAIGVHPDDVELSCSGTLLAHIAQGKKVGLLDLTRGELGTRGSAELRTQEAMNSAKLMKAAFRHQLKMADGFFGHTRENLLQIAAIVRQYQPEIVLANALEDRHPDHARAAKLTSDACFLAGLAKVETTLDGQAQERWRPKVVYHYIQDYTLHPEVIVDISPYMEHKMDLIMCFSSQFYDPNSEEPESPISSKDFLDSVRAKNQVWGRMIGCSYAEGFNVSRPIGVTNLFNLL